jgi:DNA replication and repair protein RecF
VPRERLRRQVRINGVSRRADALGGHLRAVIFSPEAMLLVVGSPALRRDEIDALAGQLWPAHRRGLVAYGRALAQRNSLLRMIREERASRDELPFWDRVIVEEGGAVVERRLEALAGLAAPLAAAHAEIAPEEPPLTISYAASAPAHAGERPAEAIRRRLAETAEKEVWNGMTLAGPHRDDAAFLLGGRDLAAFGSRGQQRTAILALKLAELEALAGDAGPYPLLLLDDVFSELDPDRRSHLVRRVGELPQSFVTTTSLADLDPALVALATAWEVMPGRVSPAVSP